MANRIRNAGFECVLTREPGGTSIGKQIRKIILSPSNGEMSAETEMGLYFSDRIQHLREVVFPAVTRGEIVISDRFTDSTMVYQGYGRQQPVTFIKALDRVMTGSYRPRWTFLLDLPLEEGLRRAYSRNRRSARAAAESRLDDESIAFHQRVRDGYARLAKREPKRFIVVSAKGSREEIHAAIWAELTRRLRRLRSA